MYVCENTDMYKYIIAYAHNRYTLWQLTTCTAHNMHKNFSQ